MSRVKGNPMSKPMKSHPVIDRNLKQIQVDLQTMTINQIGIKYKIDKCTMWRYAKIYKLKGVAMKKALSIEWTPKMLIVLKVKFSRTFNSELAKQLGVSVRTVIRKARELQLEKEPGFLDKRREIITQMAQAARPPATQRQIEQITKAGEPYRFKKGHKSTGIDYSKIWNTRRANEKKLKEALSNPY